MQKDIYKLIDKHKIISFDIFDTLAVRNVLNPFDIFSLTEICYNLKHHDCIVSGFKELRINAERAARSGRKSEITIKDIYHLIKLPDYIKDELMKTELDVEFAYIVKNPEIYPIYKYSKEKGKKIIISSDMYLSEDFISKVLSNCEIDYYDRLFLSSTIGHRKKTGDLFIYICECLKCNPNSILHIGDNKISDYIMAKAKGVDAYLIHYKRINLYHLNKGKFNYIPIQNNVAAAIIRNYSTEKKSCEKLGCQILGLPLVGFCQWVHNNTIGVNKFFLARDGYLLKKAYERLYPDESEKCHYLYLSRKSLRIPNIYLGIEYECLVEQFPSLIEYNVKIFCDLINLDKEKQEKYMQMFCNIAPVKSRSELKSNVEYKNLFYCIRNGESEYFKKQYEIFLKYLKQEGFYGKVAIIDVGWRATAQINLLKLLGGDIQISGYYFGVENAVSNKEADHGTINGYFWNWDDYTHIRSCILNGRKGLFELMFLASHGSTVLYAENNEETIPVLETVKFEQSHPEEIQNGALDFVRTFKKYNEHLPNISPIDACTPLIDFMMYPHKLDMEIGDSLCENYRIVYLAKTERVLYYVRHPKELKRDFRNSEWKVGFITRLINPTRMMQTLLNCIYEKVRKK